MQAHDSPRRALTLHQPWSSLVALGAKRIETRSWSTRYRGPLAIHAAKTTPPEILRLTRAPAFQAAITDDLFDALRNAPHGAIVAVATLVDVLPIVGEKLPRGERCVSIDDEGNVRVWDPIELAGVCGHVGDGHERPAEHEAAFGDYTPGRYAWLLGEIRPLSKPVPCRGYQGLWTVPADLEPIVEAQAREWSR